MEKESVKILFCGDFISSSPHKIVLSDDYKKLLNDCDLRCLNFEGSIVTGTPATIKGTAIMDQSENSPKWCEDNGFNLISLANNHMLDFGQKGLISTKAAFKSSILLGAGTWEEVYSIKKLEINGLRIGFIALAQCEFGILNDRWSNKNLQGCGWISHSSINSLIKEGKHFLDYLFVITHAGIEFCDIPLPEWRDRYRELIDNGADAIIGGHPHVPQGWETYKGKPIFYSLGNFYCEEACDHKYWNKGLTVIFELQHQRDIRFRVINTEKKDYELKLDSSAEMMQHISEINEKLLDNENYMSNINKICLELWPAYERVFLRGLNSSKTEFSIQSIIRYFYNFLNGRKEEYKFLINNLRCESHRFLIVRALKLITGVEI